MEKEYKAEEIYELWDKLSEIADKNLWNKLSKREWNLARALFDTPVEIVNKLV